MFPSNISPYLYGITFINFRALNSLSFQLLLLIQIFLVGRHVLHFEQLEANIPQHVVIGIPEPGPKLDTKILAKIFYHEVTILNPLIRCNHPSFVNGTPTFSPENQISYLRFAHGSVQPFKLP